MIKCGCSSAGRTSSCHGEGRGIVTRHPLVSTGRKMSYVDRRKQRAWQVAWMKRRRRAWFKAHGPCVDCGSRRQLEIDHVDPKTKVSHRIWSWSEARRNVELAKCVARCHRCHLRRSIIQLTKTGPAGTSWCYRCQEFLPVVVFGKGGQKRLRRHM